MASLKEFLKAQKQVSPLIEGKDKLETSDVAGQVITLRDFDLVAQSDGTYYSVVLLEEYPDNFLFGGSVLTQLLVKALEEYDGNMDAVREEVGKEPIKFRIVSKKAKKPDPVTGMLRTYNDIEFVD